MSTAAQETAFYDAVLTAEGVRQSSIAVAQANYGFVKSKYAQFRHGPGLGSNNLHDLDRHRGYRERHQPERRLVSYPEFQDFQDRRALMALALQQSTRMPPRGIGRFGKFRLNFGLRLRPQWSSRAAAPWR
jgi:hypothetical protein